MLQNFYPGTTKSVSVAITYHGTEPDISADTVTLRLKRRHTDPDSAAVLTFIGDVLTSGAAGIALLAMTPADTSVPESTYCYDIVWTRSTGEEYVLVSGLVTALDRVSDT